MLFADWPAHSVKIETLVISTKVLQRFIVDPSIISGTILLNLLCFQRLSRYLEGAISEDVFTSPKVFKTNLRKRVSEG